MYWVNEVLIQMCQMIFSAVFNSIFVQEDNYNFRFYSRFVYIQVFILLLSWLYNFILTASFIVVRIFLLLWELFFCCDNVSFAVRIFHYLENFSFAIRILLFLWECFSLPWEFFFCSESKNFFLNVFLFDESFSLQSKNFW